MGWEVSYEIEVLMGKSWENHGKIRGKSGEHIEKDGTSIVNGDFEL
jgi:hypothetical protein